MIYFWYFMSAFWIQDPNFLYENSFEEKISVLKEKMLRCCDYSIVRSDSVSKSGKYSLRFEINYSDDKVANNKRSELLVYKEPELEVERWYSFNLFVPSSNQGDVIPETIVQWFVMPDEEERGIQRSPPIAIRIVNDEYFLLVRSSEAMITTKKNKKQMEYSLGKVKYDEWEDWKIHVKFSPFDDGVFELRKGDQVINIYGGNCYNDKNGVAFRIGIYKWGWKNAKPNLITTKKKVIYFDDLKIQSDE